MTDLLTIIQNGNGNIKLEVTGEDLLLFSNQLISRAKHELSTAIAEARKEKYLTKEEENPISKRQQKKVNKIEERRQKRLQLLHKADQSAARHRS